MAFDNMERSKKQIVYTATDIQKYLSGKLTPAEMHAIEKAALEDPFLAEAMEGYEAMRTKNSEKELAFLKNQFSPEASGKVIPLKTVNRFTSLKIAAAVLVILGGISITYLLTAPGTGDNKSIAKTVTRQDTVVQTVPETREVDTIASIAKTGRSTPPATPAIVPPVVRTDQEVIQDTQLIYRPEILEKKDTRQISGGGYVRDQQASQPSQNPSTSNNAVTFSQEKSEAQAVATNRLDDKRQLENFTKQTNQVTLKSFAAQVVGPDNTPLPFANVSVVNKEVGTYADARGNFRLVAADSAITVEIKSAGYLPRNITLKSDGSPNRIVLAEDDVELKEKTMVAGKVVPADRKRRAVLVPDSVINVEPADGWNNYDTYITNNLSIPTEILQKKVHGEVEVSFEVESNGAITNMKVDKSLCQDCDEAALRVIKDGPRWKVKKGKKATAKVRVKF